MGSTLRAPPAAASIGAVRMGDPFTYWSGPPSRSEYEDGPHGPTSFARPSAKSIYNQRKDYGQTLLKPQSNFQHPVEHLLTLRLERELRSVEDCVGRLRDLEAQGKVWGQDLLLGVRDQDLLLSDMESREDLDSFPLSSIQDCVVTPDVGSYDSVLAISVQETGWGGTSVLLFQCHHTGCHPAAAVVACRGRCGPPRSVPADRSALHQRCPPPPLPPALPIGVPGGSWGSLS
ncbi:epidermal growth factor receptor kinase substrate 8-like protein 3 [Meleagris gallopavo]|uniref:epidermal growth factor receptor kinase substrate 8-like protein 3 n=1 Tax=Meleagris gallopavo TaxID=9103 RepID=UPI00054997CA|nr:epidermal growth factor receptor kinase substrate 8-like protein 3 [Meleagris gallopavo]